METGTILRFNQEKGWGFAKPDAGGGDVMIHVRDLRDQRDAERLTRGVRVSYAVRRGPKGLRAEDVRLLPAQDQPAAGFRDEVVAVLDDAVSQIEEIARRYGIAG